MPFGIRRHRNSTKFGPPSLKSLSSPSNDEARFHFCLFPCASKRGMSFDAVDNHQAEANKPTSLAEAAVARPQRPCPPPLETLVTSQSADSFGVLGSPCATPTPARKQKEAELREAVEQLVHLTLPQNNVRRSSAKAPLVEDGISVGLEIAHENRLLLPRASAAAPPPNSPAACEQYDFYAHSETEPDSPLKHSYFPRKPIKPAMRKSSIV